MRNDRDFVDVFDRDPDTGALTLRRRIIPETFEIDGAHTMIVSPDQRFLYAAVEISFPFDGFGGHITVFPLLPGSGLPVFDPFETQSMCIGHVTHVHFLDGGTRAVTATFDRGVIPPARNRRASGCTWAAMTRSTFWRIPARPTMTASVCAARTASSSRSTGRPSKVSAGVDAWCRMARRTVRGCSGSSARTTGRCAASPAITDTQALATCDAPAPAPLAAASPEPTAWPTVAEVETSPTGVVTNATVGQPGSCAHSADALCLLGGRFRAEVDWRAFDGRTEHGTRVPIASDDSGLFSSR